jgi:TnpA family transposase
MTDTGAYSDAVFGLFRLSNLHFCPRLAAVGGTRFCASIPKRIMATSTHSRGSA